MSDVDDLICGVLALVRETNARAERARGFDPLFELACRAAIRSPDGEAQASIELSLSYSSGGGPESAYVIEDTARVVIGPSGPTRLVIEPLESEGRELSDAALRDLGSGGLLAELRAFCAGPFPPGCPD